jgi:DNA-binding IclR family transcriptional regulator
MIIDPAVRRAVGLVLAVAGIGALVALFGGYGLVGLSGGLGVALVSGGRGREVRAADRAILSWSDPGPDGRATADDRARSVLARPRAEDWAVVAVLLALGVACLAVVVTRDRTWAVVPGAALVVLAPVLWRLDRRGLRAASRWLDSPPFDRRQPA